MREDDVVLLNGSDEDVAEMRLKMEQRRELAKMAKVNETVTTSLWLRGLTTFKGDQNCF